MRWRRSVLRAGRWRCGVLRGRRRRGVLRCRWAFRGRCMWRRSAAFYRRRGVMRRCRCSVVFYRRRFRRSRRLRRGRSVAFYRRRFRCSRRLRRCCRCLRRRCCRSLGRGRRRCLGNCFARAGLDVLGCCLGLHARRSFLRHLRGRHGCGGIERSAGLRCLAYAGAGKVAGLGGSRDRGCTVVVGIAQAGVL